MDLKIKLPFFVRSDDYHEFSEFATNLSKLCNTSVEFTEIPMDITEPITVDLELGRDYKAIYYAIFYVGSQRYQTDQWINDFLGHSGV